MLTDTQLEDARCDALATLWDTCTVDSLASPTGAELDDHGQPLGTTSASAVIACGLFLTSSAEQQFVSREQGGPVPSMDAVLRLPIDTVITHGDQVTVTHRQGQAVTAMTFEVVGTPRRGLWLLVVDLKRVDQHG